MADDLDARTEPASQKKRERALRSGSLAPSRTLLAAASTSAALVVLSYSVPATFVTVSDLFRGTMEGRLALASWGPRLVQALSEALLPTMAAVVLTTLGLGLWSTRGRLGGWSLESPQRRGSSASSFGASLRGAMLSTVLALAMIVLVARLFFGEVGSWAAHGPALPLSRLAFVLARSLRGLALTLAVVCLGLVTWELVRHERRRRQALFVTPREAREQVREEEGAPLVRAARRARQQEAATAGKRPVDGASDA